MGDGLRKVPGRPADKGMYRASSTLDGLEPGRRTVKELWVSSLGPEATQGLEPLRAFVDLEVLEINGLAGIDLGPLAGLSDELWHLRLERLEAVDLAPLQDLGGPWWLSIMHAADSCRVPPRMTLSPRLRRLSIINDARGLSGRPVKALVEAIDWSRLPDLTELHLQVGGNEQLPAVEVNPDLLRHLPNLERLELSGVYHDGSGDSPLEPPFDGLSKKLTWLRIESWDPDPLKQQLTEYLAGFVPSVYQRYDPEPDKASWTLLAPVDDGDPWATYGSFADLFGPKFETEHDACLAAVERLRAEDPDLLERLDFDPESNGTGVAAMSEADLRRALALLGVAGV
jgi:hypothetical protein